VADEAKIDEANEADLTDDADVADKAIATVDARIGDLDEVDKANEIGKEADADDFNEAIESDEADDADEVNKAIALDKAIGAVKFDEIDEIGTADDSIMIDEVVLGLLTLFLPFSRKKHSAIFTEVKGFFGINNNQLGSWNLCSLRSQNGTCRVENVFLS
jgi:hypothetical protein